MLWNGFEIKIHQKTAHYLKSLRNGRKISFGGLEEQPPPLHTLITVYKILRTKSFPQVLVLYTNDNNEKTG